MVKAVIMAGGSGTRLWPLSRASYPKQFLSLSGDLTMLQATAKRLSDLDTQSILTICNEEHRFIAAEQLREVDALGTIILEPIGRNTAPAIALAAIIEEDDPLLLILAADHEIQDEVAFSDAVTKAIPLAEAGKLVAFGIVPREPHIGYGYIKRGEAEGAGFKVDEFVEKPSFELAESYIKAGIYDWNSGMFLFRASRYLEELQKFRPDILEACIEAMADAAFDANFIRVNKQKFEQCPSDSVDYAVMEKTEDAVVVLMDAGWSDVGSWKSLWDVSAKDEAGNSLHGDILSHNVNNAYIRAEDCLVTAVGVENLVIVATKDAVMVGHKDSIEDIKQITEQLKSESRQELNLNREVSRPWGKFDSIGIGDRYQVKRITVNPGAKLSVQMHHQRAEHWIVVSGTAKVTNGDRTFMLHENESTFIPLGVIHSLENPGQEILELIEVQSGDYLGEDDIVRFSDRYGRVED